MYSVLIQNQKTMESFHEFHPFFMEALEKNKIGCCRWMESGTTLETALPELCDLTDDKEEWRAIIVRVEDDAAMQEYDASEENPYDFLINRDGADRTKESMVPLIRLTHILGGVPAPELEFECTKIVEEAKAPRTIYVPKRSKEKEAAHARLQKKYDYDGKLPSEIVLVTFTSKGKEKVADTTKNVWRTQLETNSSEFWKRNNYPSSCRFIAYDYENRGTVQKCADLFNFWMSVMLLAVNDIDPSTLQAYKLYKINTTFDKETMGKCFQEKVDLLTGMKSFINGEIKRDIENKLNNKPELPEYEMQIPVVLEIPRHIDVSVNTDEFALCAKTSNEDYVKWDGMRNSAEYTLQSTYRKAERALNESAEQMRHVNKVDEGEVVLLDQFQEEDVREDLDKMYDKILQIQGTLPDVKLTKSERELAQAEDIKESIKKRIRKITAAECLLIIIGLFILAAVPAGIHDAIKEENRWYGILMISVISIIILVITEVIVLAVQRKKFIKKVDVYNEMLEEHMTSLTQNLGIYTDFVSNMVSFTRGNTYLNIMKHKKFVIANSYNALQKHMRATNLLLDKLSKWSTAHYLSTKFKYEMCDEVSVDVDITPQHNMAYTFEYGREYCVPLNESGDMIFSPFDFVTRLSIEREELYDDAGSVD